LGAVLTRRSMGERVASLESIEKTHQQKKRGKKREERKFEMKRTSSPNGEKRATTKRTLLFQ